MVTAPDRVLLTGSSSILPRPGDEKRMPSPNSTGSTYTRISSSEPTPQALASHVGAEDLQVLAARSVECRGDRFPDVSGEEHDLRVRLLRRPMGEDEDGSGEGVVCAAWLVCLHPVAYLVGPPADEHCAGGCRDLRDIVQPHEVGDPVHRVAGTRNEAVSDIDLFTTTLPFPVLVSLNVFLRRTFRDPFRRLLGRHCCIPWPIGLPGRADLRRGRMQDSYGKWHAEPGRAPPDVPLGRWLAER